MTVGLANVRRRLIEALVTKLNQMEDSPIKQAKGKPQQTLGDSITIILLKRT